MKLCDYCGGENPRRSDFCNGKCYAKARYQKNREKFKEISRERYYKTKDLRKEKVKEYQKRHYAKPEIKRKRNAYMREYMKNYIKKAEVKAKRKKYMDNWRIGQKAFK